MAVNVKINFLLHAGVVCVIRGSLTVISRNIYRAYVSFKCSARVPPVMIQILRK